MWVLHCLYHASVSADGLREDENLLVRDPAADVGASVAQPDGEAKGTRQVRERKAGKQSSCEMHIARYGEDSTFVPLVPIDANVFGNEIGSSQCAVKVGDDANVRRPLLTFLMTHHWCRASHEPSVIVSISVPREGDFVLVHTIVPLSLPVDYFSRFAWPTIGVVFISVLIPFVIGFAFLAVHLLFIRALHFSSTQDRIQLIVAEERDVLLIWQQKSCCMMSDSDSLDILCAFITR